ncbi:hypothetical protein NUU61_004033 [Penicillium alfredii]|uniref:ADF-H domain-containing protein n=1 Tax=Penicillium alfredii TaxID=1506179 RepID=A0A9W9FKC1_9EURO|nr:uncharacterized protein NUU61_004033 [Penicillium alfredii]KAJ5101811.1 hypothetical protein NUU61_004033 [Penicillium alfredii]
MSLNGLENPAIVDAYQSALADAGGWFLLHYVSRDEVALLNRGTGGVPEVRNALDQYQETSPLYGFLQYRRRKVIIRYMPEGLSRLIQGMKIGWRGFVWKKFPLIWFTPVAARSNVQFQSVLDKFTPNDTVLPLSQASDLTESALSSACLLHTASTSITSSSSSLRRRRLMEITEDAEENGPKDTTQEPTPPSTDPRPRAGSQMSEATVVPPPAVPLTTSPSDEKTSPDLRPPPSRSSSRAASRERSSESHSPAVSPKSTDSSSERLQYRNILDEFPRPSDEVRMSTQSARPSMRDLERASTFTPKVKLGPRPSVDNSGRPRTSGTSRNPEQRPVASLPANMRSSSLRKPNVDVPRPRSQGSSFATKPSSRAPPIPPLLVPPPSIPIARPQLSPGAKSLGALSTSSGLTPEKERLMKALQQRKKNMAKRAEETKRKQSIAEEPAAEKDLSNNQENMENMKSAPEFEDSGPENQRPPPQERQPEAHTEPSPSAPEPMVDPQPPAQPEKEPSPEPLEPFSAVEPIVDTQPDAEPEKEQSPEPLEASASSVTEPVVATQTEQEQDLEALEPSQAKDSVLAQPAAQPQKGQRPEPLEASKPEPRGEVTVSDSEGGPSSHTSGPSGDTTFSADRGIDISSEGIQSETPQTVLEDETPAEYGDSTAPVQSESKDSPDPASADVDVAFENESSETTNPESEHVSPSQQPEIPSVEELEPPSVISAAEDVPESSPLPVTPSPPTPPVISEAEPSAAPVSVSVDPSSLDEPEESPVENPGPAPLDQRRRVHLEPIQVPTPEYSDDDHLLSDDSFMEELKSATVQEARPVSVKSPGGGDNSLTSSRAVSSPHSLRSPTAVQSLAVGRSASSTYPDNGPPTPVLMAKKINVSSGISSRIKALEKFSSREGTPSNSSQTVTGPSASSSVESLRKRASISLPGENQENTPPSGRPTSFVSDSFSRAPSLNHHDSRPTPPQTRRTNSISVTARIVRDSNVSPGSSGVEPSESDVLNLQASPLTVEHDTNEGPPTNTSTVEPTNHSEHRSMSISSAGSSRQTAPVSRTGSRLSFSSRTRPDESPQPTSPSSEDKKGSRASRLMRRMSSITSTSRRSIIGALSSPVQEEDSTSALRKDSVTSPASPPSRAAKPIDIGEVNVQFPETLLWKRRFMRIDENGYLILAPGTNDSSARNMIKRYHLTEFRTPCLPDEDMQELPNSILLDFLDGSTLQCACESRQGQASALQTLIDAHTSHQQ